MISDERFFAWLDGELDPAGASAVEAQVAADPELRRRADAHRALIGKMRATFDVIADAPLPSAIIAATETKGADVVDLAARRSASRPISRPMQWAAMAATLALGIVAGTMIAGQAASPIARENGHLIASGELEQGLHTRLASAPADTGPRIGLTFRDARGDICRSFTDSGTSGLACHKGGDWQIQGLFQAGEGQASDFRMAGGTDPRLGELIDSTIAGDPLDADEERKALDALR